MIAPTTRATASLPELDSVIAYDELLDAPRAFLLLRICQLAQVLRPDLLDSYWGRLVDLGNHLPPEHREAFEGLRAMIEPASSRNKPTRRGKFAREIIDRINEAAERASHDGEEATRVLRDCEQRLRDRWWPFGKRDAWAALALAWADIDRKESLRLLRNLARGAQSNLVERLNQQLPLSPEEWDTAHRNAKGGVVPVIVEILGGDDPVLTVSRELSADVASSLLSEVHASSSNPDESRKLSDRRAKGLNRYLALVNCSSKDDDQVEALMERLFSATVTASCYGDHWIDRFSVLRQVIISWANHTQLRDRAERFLSALSERHIRDFSLAQWRAMLVTSGEEAEAGLKAVSETSSNKLSSEAWFLVTLIRRGLCEEAMGLAQTSPRSMDLLPIMRRAWLCEHPETAAPTITAEQLYDDLIGQFLLAGTAEKRMEMLREKTEGGKKPLPSVLWKQPGLGMSVILSGALTGDLSRTACPAWFSKKQSPEGQFADCVRLHGYGQYCYDQIDPLLLETILLWDERHPEEVRSIMMSMWNEMRLADWELMVDLVRESVFERCQNVLSASPDAFNRLFVRWVKSTLVDRQVQRVEGDTIYRFSLKDIVPFLYCVLAAQKVGRFSPRRCDELLEIGLREYPANEDLMTAAAELYASDKGLKALRWKVPEKNRSRFLKQWQMGIIQTSMRQIMAIMMASAADTTGQ